MRVLAVTPILKTFGYMAYYDRCIKSILSQDVDFRVDHLMQSGEDVWIGTGYDRVTAKYEQARQVALAGPYDYMWLVESDAIVPRDALRKLIAADAPIAYGLFCSRHDPTDWFALTGLTRDKYTPITDDVEAARAAYEAGKVIEVKGIGHHCTLVRREVLEQIEFWLYRPVCADWTMALDAERLGFRQVCDFSVICGHLTMTPSPRVYFPDPTYRGLIRIESWDGAVINPEDKI